MSVTTARAYRYGFAGRIAPAGRRKSPEIKPFHGCRSTFAGKAHCIKDSVLLDDTCGTGDFLTNTNNDRIVKVERANAKPFSPDIARVFYRAGYIESWGRGIQKICDACKNCGFGCFG